jgi:hypothetical protein
MRIIKTTRIMKTLNQLQKELLLNIISHYKKYLNENEKVEANAASFFEEKTGAQLANDNYIDWVIDVEGYLDKVSKEIRSGTISNTEDIAELLDHRFYFTKGYGISTKILEVAGINFQTEKRNML